MSMILNKEADAHNLYTDSNQRNRKLTHFLIIMLEFKIKFKTLESSY